MTDKILQGESSKLEYKEAVPQRSINYMKTVVAFANGKGGEIVFGIEDGTHKVVGIEKEKLFETMDAIKILDLIKGDEKITQQEIANK